ncbi:hypothetical protein V1512DRAFT_274484 [Lipomyces arxii]|uniref:uncharacterized protein n=1 Tax=Lipomyces arxii TaxID=56418 RepID=UPI0034CFF993
MTSSTISSRLSPGSSTISSASSVSFSSSAASSTLNFSAPTPATRFDRTQPSSRVSASPSHKKLVSLWSEEFRILVSDYQKFSTRQAAYRANILRTGILPFLRTRQGELTSATVSITELDRRIQILHTWWVALLTALRDRPPHAVAITDRAAYFEAVFGILARAEWHIPQIRLTSAAQYQSDLNDTLKYALSRLELKPVSISTSVFAGAVLAHAFFYSPGVAPALLYLLRPRRRDVLRVSSHIGLSPTEYKALTDTAKTVFPPHLAPLVGVLFEDSITRKPDVPAALEDELYGAWVRRFWGSQDNDVFASFLKQYYLILSGFIGPVATVCECTPDEAIMAMPGIMIFHAAVLAVFDKFVGHDRDLQVRLLDGEVNVNSTVFRANNMRSAKQASQMRILLAFKEMLNSRSVAASYSSTYVRFFESSILHATAKQTSVYDATACVGLCDVSDSTLSVLAGMSRHDDLNWVFWRDICKRMLDSRSCMNELRAFAFLYSFWGHFAKDDRAVDWILSDEVFNEYFHHWAPLVRAYYMRLLCWRVIRRPTPMWEVAKDSLRLRMFSLHAALRKWVANGRSVECTPSSPMPGRRLAIVQCIGQDTLADRFFKSSTREMQIAPPVSRYDVHDEDIFIASSSSSPSSSSTSPSSIHSGGDYFSASKVSTVLRRLKSIRSSFSASGTISPPELAPHSLSLSPPGLHRTLSVSSFNSAMTTTADPVPSTSGATVSNPAGMYRSYCFMLQPAHAPPHPRSLLVPPIMPFSRAGQVVRSVRPDIVTVYSGRALAEWNSVVRQYEHFVNMRHAKDGIESEFDVGTPSIMGEL